MTARERDGKEGCRSPAACGLAGFGGPGWRGAAGGPHLREHPMPARCEPRGELLQVRRRSGCSPLACPRRVNTADRGLPVVHSRLGYQLASGGVFEAQAAGRRLRRGIGAAFCGRSRGLQLAGGAGSEPRARTSAVPHLREHPRPAPTLRDETPASAGARRLRSSCRRPARSAARCGGNSARNYISSWAQ